MMVRWDQVPSPPSAQAHASPGSPDFSSSGLLAEFDDPLRFNQSGGELDAWIDSVVRTTPPKKVPTPTCTIEEARRVTKSTSPPAQPQLPVSLATSASGPAWGTDKATNKKEDSKSASTGSHRSLYVGKDMPDKDLAKRFDKDMPDKTWGLSAGTVVENFASNPSTQVTTEQVYQPGEVAPGPLAIVSAGPWGMPAHPGSFPCGPPSFPPPVQPSYFPPEGNPQLQGYPLHHPHMMMTWPAPPYGPGYMPAYGQPPPGMYMHWHAPVMAPHFAAVPGHPVSAEGTQEPGKCSNCQNQQPSEPITPVHVPSPDPANAEGPPLPAKPAAIFPQLPIKRRGPVCIPKLPVKGQVWKKTFRRKLGGRAKVLHEAKVKRDRLAALQQAGQNSTASESLVSATPLHKVVNPGHGKQKVKSNKPISKPPGGKKPAKDASQQTSKNTARKEKRQKENIPVKKVLKDHKNDRGPAIAKGLAMKKQRDLASMASNAAKPTKGALQMKLKADQPITPLNAHSMASAKSVVSISDLTGQLKPACTAKLSTSVPRSPERPPAQNSMPEGTTAERQATGRGSSIAEDPQLADDASGSPPPDAEAQAQGKSEEAVEDPPEDDYVPPNGTIAQACLIALLEEAANGNPVVTKNLLYDVMLSCPALDTYYRGLLDDKNFWWKTFRWIQGMKYYTCPRKGTLTAELTQKGKDVAVLCYQQALEAEILPPNSKIDEYIRQKEVLVEKLEGVSVSSQ